MEGNRKRRVLVYADRKALSNTHLNSKFFKQFSTETFFRRLPRIDLSSGKLPLVWKTHDGTSLSSKNETVTLYDGTSNINVFGCIFQVVQFD